MFVCETESEEEGEGEGEGVGEERMLRKRERAVSMVTSSFNPPPSPLPSRGEPWWSLCNAIPLECTVD